VSVAAQAAVLHLILAMVIQAAQAVVVHNLMATVLVDQQQADKVLRAVLVVNLEYLARAVVAQRQLVETLIAQV
jgi:hypothetical protein